MPLELHPVEQIINVHWGSGLAVEFGDHAQDAPKPQDLEQE
jgi:hypothetical protein